MALNETVRKLEDQRFEFALYINNHIICQRYFHIRDYDESAPNVKEMMDSIAGMNNGDFGELGLIPNHLKNKTLEYLWDNYNPFYAQADEYAKNNSGKVDNFQFEVKVDKAIIGKCEFPGNVFPPKVRYGVDIKELIPTIISEIRDFLSVKSYQNA